MLDKKMFAVFSRHYCTDGDYDQLEFVTYDEEFAKQYVLGISMCRGDQEYHYDEVEVK